MNKTLLLRLHIPPATKPQLLHLGRVLAKEHMDNEHKYLSHVFHLTCGLLFSSCFWLLLCVLQSMYVHLLALNPAHYFSVLVFAYVPPQHIPDTF